MPRGRVRTGRGRRRTAVSSLEPPVSSRTRNSSLRRAGSLSPSRQPNPKSLFPQGKMSGSAANAIPPPVIHFPMPAPGTPGAPKFKDRDVTDFVATLEAAATGAGVPLTELPALLPRYCNRRVRQVIRFETDFAGTDWDLAKEKLKTLYKYSESRHRVSYRKLQDFAERSSKDKTVTGLRSFDKYIRNFNKRLGNLIGTNKITAAQAHLAFYSGLPENLRKGIKPEIIKVVTGTLSATNPPRRDQTINIVRAYYDEDYIDKWARHGADSDSDSDTSSSPSDSDDTASKVSGSDSDSDSEHKKKKKKKKKKGKKVKGKKDKDDQTNKVIDKLAEGLLKVQVALDSLKSQPAPVVGTVPPMMTMAAGYGVPQGPRRCFMCDMVEGMGLTHSLGMRFCPETDKLMTEGLMILKGGRFTKPDGTELPRASPGSRGISALLRAERWANQRSMQHQSQKGKERELPPHMNGASSSYAPCSSIGLFREDERVLSGGVRDLSMEEAMAFPVQTRSQVASDKEREEEKNKKLRFEYSHTAAKFASPSNGDGTRPHHANTEGGWKEKKRNDRERRAQDDAGKGRTGKPNVRYTSDVQDSVDLDSIEDQILNAKVTLPLRQILGMSSELQKRFAHLTKTHGEEKLFVQTEGGTEKWDTNIRDVIQWGNEFPPLW